MISCDKSRNGRDKSGPYECIWVRIQKIVMLVDVKLST